MMRKYQNECHGDLADEHRLQSYSADADAARLLVGEVSQFAKRFNSSCNVGMALLRQVL